MSVSGSIRLMRRDVQSPIREEMEVRAPAPSTWSADNLGSRHIMKLYHYLGIFKNSDSIQRDLSYIIDVLLDYNKTVLVCSYPKVCPFRQLVSTVFISSFLTLNLLD